MQQDKQNQINEFTDVSSVQYSSFKNRLDRIKLTLLKIGRKKTALFGIGILFVGLVAGYFALMQGTDWRSSASATGVDISLVPADKQLNPGETATWDIFMNTQDNTVTVAQLELTYDDALFEYVSMTAGTVFNNIVVDSVAFGNDISMTLGVKPVQTSPGVYTVTPVKGTGIIAHITLKAKSTVTYGTGALNFVADRGNGTGTIMLSDKSGNTNIVGDMIKGSVTIGTAPASPVPSPSLPPSPSPSPSPSPVQSPSPSPSLTPSASPISTPTPTPSPSPTATPRITTQASPTPSSTATNWKKIDDANSTIVYSAGWLTSNQQNTYMNTQHYSSTKGASATLTFTGTGVRYYTARTPRSGLVDIYLDGVLKSSVNTYGSTIMGDVLVYEKTGLTNTQHTLKIANNASAAAPNIVVDGFATLSGASESVAPTPKPTPAFEDAVDTVTIQKASVVSTFLRKKLVLIEVVANSTQQPTAKLTITNYGSMRYNARRGAYVKSFWVLAPTPTSITVKSSLGGTADAVVDTSLVTK